jgi:hypothetical protein
MAELSDPEVKAAISAAVNEATERLAAKNKELLGELKEARKGQQIDPEVVTRLETKVHDLQDALDAAEKTAKKATAEAEKTASELATEREATNKLAINNGLSAAIAKANVAPHFVDAVTAMISSKTTLDNDRNVMVGDKPLSDFVAEWSQSDEGKHYIIAPNNSGGGANGSGGEGGAKTLTRSEFDSMSHTDRVAFSKDGGKLTD